MKHFISLAALLISTQITFAQTEKINLSDYKLPEMKRHQLDFFFDTEGRNTTELINYGNDIQKDTLKNEATNFNGFGNIGYSFYRNSQKIQAIINAHLSGSYNKYKNTNNENHISDNSTFNGWSAFSSDFKYFPGHKNWFLTTAPYLYFAHSENNNLITNYESKTSTLNTTLKIGGGKGRIEQIQDFRQAILLANELNERGALSREFSKDEMASLASLMSELKNERFFDSRKRKESDLVALDSFLTANGLVENTTVRYFAGLEDIWSYGGLQVRESGNQITLSMIPQYDFSKYNTDSENYITETLLMNYGLTYVSKRPVSLKWQADYSSGIGLTTIKQFYNLNDDSSDKSYKSNFYVDGKIGFYPNTRTDFTLGAYLYIINQSNEKLLDNEFNTAQLQVSTAGYYYISEKLRLGYEVRYDSKTEGVFNSDFDNSTYHRLYYGLNINYAIF